MNADDKAKQEEALAALLAELTRARVSYDAERSRVTHAFAELALELSAIEEHFSAGRVTEAQDALESANDLAYDLTGSCDELEEIGRIVGHRPESEDA